MQKPQPPSPAPGINSPTLPATRLRAYRRALRAGAIGHARSTAPLTGLVIALFMAVALTGCDVRLETPPPTEPVPDAIELVRRTAADDALRLSELATITPLATADNQAWFTRLAGDSQAHLAALGGVYESGIAVGPEADLGAEHEVEPTGELMPADSLTFDSWDSAISSLNAAAARNLNAAAVEADGAKARLLASIGTSQVLAAARLATLAGWADYDPISALVAAGWADESADSGTDPAEHLGEPEGDEATGITVADFQAIVQSEDAARYAFEVYAARSEGDLRAALRQRARVHGARAEAWAQLGQLAETDQDPRLVAYQIPEGLSPAELVLFFEKELTTRWAALIAAAAPGARGPLIEALLASQLTVAQWGGAVATFPGMPELTDQFGSLPLEPDQPTIPYEWAAQLEEVPEGPVTE